MRRHNAVALCLIGVWYSSGLYREGNRLTVPLGTSGQAAFLGFGAVA
jgi:hypothetical protein